MKTNITLKLDAALLREVKVIAAEADQSISRLLTERLEALVRERVGYDRARRRATVALKQGFDLHYAGYASRDELHER